MKSGQIISKIVVLVIIAAFVSLMCSGGDDKTMTREELVARGQYLVTAAGCGDCHSPKTLVDNRPVEDVTRRLSGAPADAEVPVVPKNVLGPDKWGAMCTNDMTTWYGPWGVSFATNLTPDQVTGIGAWTEQSFIDAMRNGKHLGAGRDILPPMPWQNISKYTDEDLKAIFAHLKSLKPIENMVHQPIPPNQL